MRNFLTVSLFFFFFVANAQPWYYVGDTMASSGDARIPRFKLQSGTIPYISYYGRTAGNVTGPVVRLFNGTNWNQVGPDIDTGYALHPSIDFDTMGVLHVAYSIYKNNIWQTYFKYFNGSNWVPLGQNPITPDGTSYHELVIDKNTNTPYLAFRDYQNYYSASVMKFNGSSWSLVGPAFITPYNFGTGASFISFAINKNSELFLAYLDVLNYYRISVKKFNGTNWVYVGNQFISGVWSAGCSLVTDSQGLPSVIYIDANGTIFVKHFNGTSWVQLGQPIALHAQYANLTIDKYDRLYFAATDSAGYATAFQFSGGAWTHLGNSAISPTVATYPTIAINNNNMAHVCYLDQTERYVNGYGPLHIASVKMLRAIIVTGEEDKNLCPSKLEIFPNPSAGVIQINFNTAKQIKGTVQITNTSGQLMYREEFMGGLNRELNLSKLNEGIYFIEIKTAEATERKKIILE